MRRTDAARNQAVALGLDSISTKSAGTTDRFGAWSMALAAAALIIGLGVPGAAGGQDPITGVSLIGEVEHLFVDDINDVWSSGTIIVCGQSVTIPRNLVIELPANRLTVQQIFAEAPPACLAVGESGLALSDTCRTGEVPAFAMILGNRSADGSLIAGDIFLAKAGAGVAEGMVPVALTGRVTYVDHADGYLRVNGIAGDPLAGAMVRINDPTGRFTIQQGLGCDGGPNCSPDVRFGVDFDNYTITYTTGYPACLPSTVTGVGNRVTGSDAAGQGDPFCPASNRLLNADSEVPDSTRFAPIQVGDPIFCEGNWETILGVRFFSCHTLTVMDMLNTRLDPTQPDYMIFEEAEWDVAGFENERVRLLLIGQSTRPESQVDVYSLHIDPATGLQNEYPLASTVGNPDSINQGIGFDAGGIWKVRFDIDFIEGAPVRVLSSACVNLTNAGFLVCPNGGTMEEEFSIVQPPSMEIQGYTRHSLELNPGVLSFDVQGNETPNGGYLTPVGIGFPEFVEINLDKVANPLIFTGVPWKMDRRLGPGGCVDTTGDDIPDCESPATAPVGSLALDPFPFSGQDPRTQANTPPLAVNRVLSYHPFGPTDIMPWPPASPTAQAFTLAAPPVLPCTVVNNAPVGTADVMGTLEDVALAMTAADLTANDIDADHDTLALFGIDQSSVGGGSIVSDLALGTISFQPGPDFTGIDSFSYRVTDGHGGIATATVTVDVIAVNDAPIANDDDTLTPAGAPLTLSHAAILGNDDDVDGDPLAIVAVDALSLAGGTVADDGTTITYTPPSLFVGQDSFGYTVSDGSLTSTATVRVHVDNNPPIANDDVSVTPEDTTVDVMVLANDGDPDLDTLVIAAFTDGAQGTVSESSPGVLTYAPAPNFFGPDSFTYTITDGRGGFAGAAVSVSVLPINDPPFASTDTADFLEDTVVPLDVLANDSDLDGDPLALVTFTPPFFGTVTDLGGGILQYVPDLNFNGPDAFNYTISDGNGGTATGSVSLFVHPVNDPPVAAPDLAITPEDQAVTFNVLANDSDPDNLGFLLESFTQPLSGVVTGGASGVLTYTPPANFNGVESFSYTLSDGVLTSIGAVTVNVVAVNDPPVANPDSATTDEDTPVDISVLLNDTDLDGDALVIIGFSQGLNGLVVESSPGIITYSPDLNIGGILDTFTYTIMDANNATDTSSVTVQVVAVNDVPVAADDSVTATEDVILSIPVAVLLANDSDGDQGDTIELFDVAQPLHGSTLFDAPAATIEYIPDPNYNGPDSFTYTISDSAGAVSAPGTVNITVNAVNDAPIALDDTAETDQDVAAVIDVLANDSDIDGDALIVSSVTNGLNGAVAINGDGTVTYTPNAGFFGSDQFQYLMSDGADTDIATVDVTVFEVVAPLAVVVRGDVNVDGTLDLADPIQTMVLLFQGVPVSCVLSADANDDETVDIGDIIFVLNHLFAQGAQPAPPYPHCGVDPTEGTLTCDTFDICL